MRVDGVNRETIQGASPIQAMDSVSKNLRAQIANAQKQLQELAANKEMEPEEKMERRKEIQQRITELNAQLRQHEMEEKMKEREEAWVKIENLAKANPQVLKKENNMKTQAKDKRKNLRETSSSNKNQYSESKD